VRALFQVEHASLSATLHTLNDRVMQIAQGEKYITFFAAVFDPVKRTLEYVNCGHNPPLFVDPSGRDTLLEDGCVGLGMFRDIPSMNVGTIAVPVGSVLCCYTDGLVEQENDLEVPFGTDRLLGLLSHHQGQTLEAVHRTIVAALDAFRGEEPPLDDTAMLSCRFS
jgi:sigma-B regulation protein RsbU (phosphoserine phosphatase)